MNLAQLMQRGYVDSQSRDEMGNLSYLKAPHHIRGSGRRSGLPDRRVVSGTHRVLFSVGYVIPQTSHFASCGKSLLTVTSH